MGVKREELAGDWLGVSLHVGGSQGLVWASSQHGGLRAVTVYLAVKCPREEHYPCPTRTRSAVLLLRLLQSQGEVTWTPPLDDGSVKEFAAMQRRDIK